tara:strand:+ start:203 stop:487 length:285 start_codon:yes stop_codon:yes gene_type:complete
MTRQTKEEILEKLELMKDKYTKLMMDYNTTVTQMNMRFQELINENQNLGKMLETYESALHTATGRVIQSQAHALLTVGDDVSSADSPSNEDGEQ